METLHKIIALFLACLQTAACAPTTMQDVREKHSGEYTFAVHEPYQKVYRTILYQARKCFATGMITAQMVVDGDLFTDLKTGNVSVALHGGAGVNTFLVIDIKESTDMSTAVTVYNSVGTWEKPAKAVEEWVIDGSTECKSDKSN